MQAMGWKKSIISAARRIASVELGRAIIPWMGEGKGLCEISAVAPLGLESRI